MSFEGKTAIITGAAGAIGLGIAKKLCEQGARVLLTDLDQTKLDRTCNDLGGAPKCQALAADVTDYRQVQAVVQLAQNIFDEKIDILVNVAGIVGQGRVEDIDEADWERMFAVNCRGTFLFAKAVVPIMKARGGGKILNFSSKSGKTGSALMSHYSAAKAAVIGFTQALAFELAGDNINVNCVCPGITDNTGVWTHVSAGYIENLKMPRDQVVEKFTAKIPLGRLASIEDVASVSAFLCSAEADYMTGQAVNITGGREMH
ncbi:MAG: SDR family oxidoreductase [Pirellulales bacterium]|nr:SDR family oxidoreductase [Pirellulales bacterium]